MMESWEPDGFDPNQSMDDQLDNVDEMEQLPSFAKSNRRRPAILMITVIAGGLTGIVVMRSLTGGIGQVMADTGIEQTVSGFLDFMRKGETSVAATDREISKSPFEDLGTDHYADFQVPAEDLKCNPFVIPWSIQHDVHTVVGRTDLSPRQQRIQRLKEMQEYADLLELQMVMTGSNPIATINGRAVRISDEIGVDEVEVTCRLLSVTSQSVQVEILDEDLDIKTVATIPLRRYEKDQ